MLRIECVATQAEEIVDRAVRREEPLNMAHRLEPAHFPFALPSGLMRNLGSVVHSFALLVDDTW